METTDDDHIERSEDDSITYQIRSLDKVKRRINELEAELKMMYEKRTTLEATLATYRCPVSPINGLPVETLVQIFDEVAYVGNSEYLDEIPPEARKVRDLMLVCRFWNDIVISSPRLWRNIYFIATREEYGANWVAKQLKYVELSMTRSKGLPLKVIIDLRQLPGSFGHTKEQLIALTGDLVPEDQVERWLLDLDWDDCPLFKHYYRSYENLVHTIVGENGIHLARYQSLSLLLSDDDWLAEVIWPVFDYPAPKLQHLHLLCDGEPRGIDGKSQNYDFQMPSLLQLKLEGYFTLDNLPICGGLRDLDLCILTWDGFGRLLQLTSLHTLRIDIEDPEGQPPVSSIQLPKLQHLIIAKNFPPRILQLFHFDHLPKLTLEDDSYSPPSFPRANLFLKAKYVVYRSEIPWLTRPELGEMGMKLVLFGLFPQLLAAHTICIPELLLDVALRMVELLRSGDHLPALRLIRAIDPSGNLCGKDHVFDPIEQTELC
jgi:hypothetical protein